MITFVDLDYNDSDQTDYYERESTYHALRTQYRKVYNMTHHDLLMIAIL